ncbi:MAG: bifunctional proline dehydrogenase/L-glutamate gamma-semialdehyde dehydrogenase [Phycisphaeraceae bacterium]|nr:bifunctional proline dehydrogenase/L-glutamate gamma-semialdehyde dehydrogenase [Phycisphaeraceae bacterium]
MALFSKKSKASPGAGRDAVRLTGGSDAAEARILELGRELLDRARDHKAGVLSAKFYSDKLMNWSMKDHGFKVQLFRFVDTFPMLTTPEMIHDHLVDYLSQPGVKVPATIDLGLKAGGLAKGLMGKTIAGQIRSMAQKFIAGTDAASALPRLKELWEDGIGFSVDLLGEACISDPEADAYRDKYLDLIQNLPGTVAGWKGQERLERDHVGEVPRVNVSIKISSLAAKVDPIDQDASIERLMVRLLPILEVARDKGVFVNFDMEHDQLKALTLDLFRRCVERIEFHAGLAMQAYLKSGERDAREIAAWARGLNRPVTVRLVKGAYWDYETIHAEMQGWPNPVWTRKWETDACFERMSEVFLDATPRKAGEGGIRLALGSHNARSIAAALAGLERRSLPREAIELQMLHGMADQLKYAASEMGLRVREYVPVGEMIPGMAYLVRRLLENTSNESWLKAGFLDNADPSALLARPGAVGADARANGEAAGEAKPDLYMQAAERHRLSPAVEGVGDGKAFVNEPVRDFANASQREAFGAAVRRAVVPKVANDTPAERAIEMVNRAQGAFAAWRDVPARVRAGVLVRAAAIMRARRDELSGVMVKEAGKTWREADADTCEAIDFCEFYARCAAPLFERGRMGRFIGELDEHWHQARGVAVVISPWNFPLAIATGMTVASLVTGNTTILKPAEQTPGIARLLCEIVWEALGEALAKGRDGARPEDVLQFCPGQGETVGAALVRDPRVALIAFTGSKAVGLDILHASAPPSPFAGGDVSGLTHVKRVVCEMGGKNALIVDASADLDEAVVSVRQSAFGFQGQKCSACSRVIVVDEEGESGPHMTHFLRRFVEATRALIIGDPADASTDVGPVIDESAATGIRRFVEIAKKEGCRVELEMELPEGDAFVAANRGRFIAPTIFSGVTPEHTIAREEIFGPVVAVLHAKDFGRALEIANGVPYKLTGGVYTRKPAHIERAKREFRVGNLYLNRGITGAIVGRHPFGGFGMSGVGSKAGGLEYLLQFVEPRACAENMMRRGFAPEL